VSEETFREKTARLSKERKTKAEERRIEAWNKRKAMTFKQALDKDWFGVDAGNRYCRKCAINALKKEYF
jgi:hypothetical protein